MASVLKAAEGFELAGCCNNLPAAIDCLRSARPDIVLVHLTSLIGLAELGELSFAGPRSRIVLWGEDLGGEFAFQAMRLGVRGIVAGGVSIDGLLAVLRNVHGGALSVEIEIVETVPWQRRAALTKREGQIISLVAQGLTNKAIAGELGITEGTVKAYLHKLFRKLGLIDRLDMAFYGLKNLFGGQAEFENRSDGISTRFSSRTLPPQRVN